MPAVIPRRVRAFATGLVVAALTVGGVALGASPAIADDAGSITGTVTGAAPGASVTSGATVTAYTDGTTIIAARTWTAPNGSYTLIGVPSGAYRVAVRQPAPSAWLDQPITTGFFGPSLADLATLPVVQVTSGQSTADDIELAHRASISGRVTDETSGSGVADVTVTASPQGGGNAASAVTATDGSFTVWTEAGTFGLTVNPTGGLVQSSAPAAITVVMGEAVTSADIRLTRGGTVSGTVTYSTGEAASGVSVTAWDSAGGGVINATGTDANGRYTIDSLPTGTYKIGFGELSDFPPTYHPVWYGGVEDISAATPVDVVAGDGATGIDAVVVASTELMTPGDVRVIGNATVGEGVSVDTGTWTPALVSSTTQWFRDGEAIVGAVWPFYMVTQDDLGKRLTVQVTGYASGYAATTATSAPSDIVGKRMTPGAPTVTGTVAVGRTLTAKPGDWTPRGATFEYQWLRWGQDIAGATAKTYRVSLNDQGVGLSVRVTGRRSGWGATSATSSSTSPVPTAPSVTAGSVSIAGKPRVGSTLTARVGTWAPGGLSFSYQWLLNGAVIDGATAKTYSVIATDAGSTLSVRVIGSKATHSSATQTSASTAAVSAG